MEDTSLRNMVISVDPTDPQTMQKHLRAVNPHPQYVLVDDLKDTMKIHVGLQNLNNVEIDPNSVLMNHVLAFNGNAWSPTDINLLVQPIEASISNLGVVRLATNIDIANGANGSLATTPYSVKTYCVATFSPKDHTHSFVDITNKPFETKITDLNSHKTDTIVTPIALADYSPKNHTHPIADVETLQTKLDEKSNVGHTHVFSEVKEDPNPYDETDTARDLQTVLDTKSDVGHQHDMAAIIDYVPGIYALLNGSAPLWNINTGSLTEDPRDCPPGYIKIPVYNEKSTGKKDHIIVQWGYAICTSGESLFEVTNIPYNNMSTILHTGFTVITRTDGDINEQDLGIQLRSILRDSNTGFVSGFQCYIQHFSSKFSETAKFLWYMIGLDNKAVYSNDKFTLVLETGVTRRVTYHTEDKVSFIKGPGSEKESKTAYIGLTMGSRSNKACSTAQLSYITETTSTTTGEFAWFMQDQYAGNTANRNGHVDWMKLGFNRYTNDNTLPSTSLVTANKGGTWQGPANDNSVGLTNYLEIPLFNNVNGVVSDKVDYHPDKQYMVVPLTNTKNSQKVELVVEWGDTPTTTAQGTFTQVLNSKNDSAEDSDYRILFVDITGRLSKFNDNANWLGQYVDETDTGFSYYSQATSSGAIGKAISYTWTSFAIRKAAGSLPSVGDYTESTNGPLVSIPLRIESNGTVKSQNLIIQFGLTGSQKVQNGTDNLWSITVDRRLPQVLHVSLITVNADAAGKRDISCELYFGPDGIFSHPGMLSSTTTQINYSMYRLSDGNENSRNYAAVSWMVVGLTEETQI